MAEIDTGGGKKVSTKVDMTPMVDLGFLLITFFMLTTTMSKPKTMEINMPDKTEDKKKDKIEVKESHTLTLLLDKDNKIFWYRGMLKPDKSLDELTKTDFKTIRKTLLDLKKEIGSVVNSKTKKTEWAIVVVIKLTDRAKYRNMVDILDEMNITDIQKYAIVDLAEADEDYLARYLDREKGGGSSKEDKKEK
ncbi:MAG: biopolymer transporter ExbD [Bacteroidetes bacterium]|nr:MAG: biopolymer transporter ExbD [Bacteroidota bacterium]